MRRAGCSYVIGTMTNNFDACIPNNITIIPRYHINDSLSDQVSRCNYCGKEWNEFWVCYAYVTRSLINRIQLIKRSSVSLELQEVNSQSCTQNYKTRYKQKRKHQLVIVTVTCSRHVPTPHHSRDESHENDLSVSRMPFHLYNQHLALTHWLVHQLG